MFAPQSSAMQTELTPKRVFINPIYKDKATVLITKEESGGAYMLAELEIAPGGRNTPHTHSAFEETFTAVTGQLGVMLQGRKRYLHPGESVTVPRYAPHYFFNDGDEPVTCRIRFMPGHDGFVKGLAIAYGLAADGCCDKQGMPKSFAHLALLIDLTDTKPAGVLGWLYPLFRRLAKKARQQGVEGALLRKYYYEPAVAETAKVY